MTGLNHNLITQRFKLNNKVALITGAHLGPLLYACGHAQDTSALLPSLSNCRLLSRYIVYLTHQFSVAKPSMQVQCQPEHVVLAYQTC